tara:strand:- start:475 stop:588 length:114 start_codon:yes stop_codon:yes gene_type:complete
MILLFVVINHGGRRPGLSNAPVDMEYDNNIEQRNLQT